MVIIRIWEGLGNQLFQYAFAKAIQIQGKQVHLDRKKIFDEIYNEGNIEREYSLDFFCISISEATEEELSKYSFLEEKNAIQRLQKYLSSYYVGKYAFVEEKKCGLCPTHFFLTNHCYVKGWFQNPQYFNKIRNILLKELQPKNKIKISSELRNILNTKKIVAVHFRRGDYIKVGCAIPKNYYKKAFSYMKNQLKDSYTYLIFSDNTQWVKNHIDFNEETYFVGEKESLSDCEELMLMSKCNHTIIANSTFSWWGAWLNTHGDKIVIAPKKWYLKENKEMIPKEWIRM